MVAGPAHWLRKLMQLTKISWDFKLIIVALGIAFLVVAWIGEKHVFPRLARAIGHAKQAVTKQTKKRKEYKLIQERMRM
jgi:cation-transporting P-type ATPase 13A2